MRGILRYVALPRDYTDQACSLARTLEIVGERWTLLIVRDALYGVRRFTDFTAHLGIPRAVLTDRLAALVEHGILRREPAASGRDEYRLTDKGTALWPVVRSLIAWGDDYYAPRGPRRYLQHTRCGTRLTDGHCALCGVTPGPADITLLPGPGLEPPADPISAALVEPHRMLEPIIRV